MRDIEEGTAVSDRKESRRQIAERIRAEHWAKVALTLPVPGGLSDAELVSRWVAGESADVLAKMCSVDRRTVNRRISRYMLTEAGEADLATQALTARVADADHDLEHAEEFIEVAKARERARFARMDLERRRPKLYGVKQEVEHVVAPVLNIVLLDRPSGERDVTPVAVLESKVVVGGEK